MNTNRDLNYRLYTQKTYGFTRSSIHDEYERYEIIKSGNVEKVKQHIANSSMAFLEGAGRLSDDPLKNLRYHFIVAVALISRTCIKGGLEHDTAYTLSDIYIQRADKADSTKKIMALFAEMEIDFTTRMKDVKKANIVSLHIRKCIDYIYDHLHEDLSVKKLAVHIGLNPSYLSKLFARETGVSIKQFVTNAKISTAENLLKFSDFSYLDISLALGFSSQSAFISVFKKQKGITPKKYREIYYATNENLQDYSEI